METTIMENQMEKKLENEMETVLLRPRRAQSCFDSCIADTFFDAAHGCYLQ